MLNEFLFSFPSGANGSSTRVVLTTDMGGHPAHGILLTLYWGVFVSALSELKQKEINEQSFSTIEVFIAYQNWYFNILLYIIANGGMQAFWGDEYFAPEIAFKYCFRQQVLSCIQVHFLQPGNADSSYRFSWDLCV